MPFLGGGRRDKAEAKFAESELQSVPGFAERVFSGGKEAGVKGMVCRNIVVGPSANLPYGMIREDSRGLIAAMRWTGLDES